MAVTPFRIEAWVEYIIGMLILLWRIAYRVSKVGKNWNGDDYFAVLAVIFLTGETAMLELIGQWGSIVGLTDAKVLSLSDAQKNDIVKGAKANVTGWCLYITLIWCLKACMLYFFRRLTLDTRQKRLVIVAAVACVCSYLATIGVVLLRCLPFKRNWQLYPYPGDECGSPNQIFLTLVITNVLTDILILYIPLPLLWVVQVPIGRKVIYCLWLTTGAFVIVASLLRCVLSFQNASDVDVSTIWAIRETFVGIIAVNVPILGPWLAKKFSLFAQQLSGGGQSHDPNSGLPTIITIGQRSMRVGQKEPKSQSLTGWATFNDSREYVLDPMRDSERSDAASSKATSSHVSCEAV